MWIEVATTYGRTLLDVTHLRPTSKRRGHLALGLGAALCLGGLGLFASEVGQDWSGYALAVTQAQLRGEVRPPAPGLGSGGLGGGLALLGLVPLVFGLVRLREPSSLALRGPAEAAELRVEAGASETWACTASARLPVPAGGLVIEHGALTLAIRPVAPETATIARDRLDLPLGSLAAAAAGLLGFVAVLLHMSPETLSISALERTPDEARWVARVMRGTLPPASDKTQAAGAEEVVSNMPKETGGSPGSRSARPRRGPAVARGPAKTLPALDRGHDPSQAARSAGVLALLQRDTFIAPGSEAYAGADGDADVWAGAAGAEVGELGLGGLGLVGTGRGGSLAGEAVGLGEVGLIGKGGSGQRSTAKYGKGVAFSARKSRELTIRCACPEEPGSLDKGIIRRTVRAHLQEIRHCYDQALIRDSSARGRMAVQFMISGAGQVTSAAVVDDAIGDPTLSSCIAQAVRRWKFPRTEGGGPSIVTYPFVLEPG
ncbi:AgmX/PglI C-terminal domain-containing protein [Nannocystis sp. SCPEA4]|uniref:AgmX/PglI C-terminal domain-containing protein n=1 Tax=Nannocystis sp. SCPEA4 TaxID=2996787 RepID=UPI00226E0AFB|nr:AgmX/PglI C-terminal domain-containing protein [Nannocystis sp. SCPEA4]MCY1059335.1 AgmX/PglI C-terminal domain-containing protein [Nannocystis sp. SCPEA4]